MADQNPIQETLEIVLGQIQEIDRQGAEKRRTANDLCRLLGQPPMFADVDIANLGISTRGDEYYGIQMPEVIRSILEKRKRANLGAATVNEIYQAMLAGGYHFQAQNDSYAKRGIYGIVGSDPRFHKLPGGRVGLAEWYPAARSAPEQNGKKSKAARKGLKASKPARSPREPKQEQPAGPNKRTRLQQVRELLLANGPMERKAIREKSGLPEGTVAYLLNDSNFKHQPDGRWYVHEET